jgi:hypothetical protein
MGEVALSGSEDDGDQAAPLTPVAPSDGVIDTTCSGALAAGPDGC